MSRRIPKLCRHKATNRAYVTDPFAGKPIYLGDWGTPEAQANYDEWVHKLLDRRRDVASGAPSGSIVSVARLVLDYLVFAREYYRKGGKETTEVNCIVQALNPVNKLHGTLPANEFGPDQLKSARQWMIDEGWARGSINKQIQRVRRVFRWGVEHGLIKTETLAALVTVPGLRKGRSAARETEPVEPVSLHVLETTLPRLDPTVRAMVEIQLHADMRPGEMVIMRPCDIDRSVTPWLYIPHTHKTEHHGRQRRVWLGPKVRQVLAPLILKCPRNDGWIFPSRARGKHAATRTHWTVSGFREAIRVACEEWPDGPQLPTWHPNQLRHTQATAIRREFGAEAAQAVLGHAHLSTSEIYAEKNEALAKDIAEKLG